MRSRTIREGSVGLVFLLGFLLFGGVVFWLRDFNFRQSNYNLTIRFDNANHLVAGSTVRYRGVKVGEVKEIIPQADGVAVKVTIDKVDLSIPREGLVVEANQSGLVGESSIDMFLENEQVAVSKNAEETNPISEQCNSQIIVCENDKITGEVGASLARLIRSTSEAAEALNDPKLLNNLIELTKSAQEAADGIAQTSQELSQISGDVAQQLEVLSETTETTSDQLVATAKEAETLMRNLNTTAQETDKLIGNLNTVVVDNRENINTTLTEISQSSQQLNRVLSSLSPTIEKLNSNLNSGDTQTIMDNLETLSTNAAKTSENLRNASEALGSSENLMLLQQTLDSARATFENTQKITSEIDEITGDPKTRKELKQLIEGLSDLLSSTQQLEQQLLAAQLEARQQQEQSENSSKNN